MKSAVQQESETELLKIITFPDPALARRSKPVERVTDGIRTLAARMIKTMRKAPGLGLAAPQVGVLKRLIVIDPSAGNEDEGGEPLVMVNPEIVETAGEEIDEEGCLSLPDIYADLPRPSFIKASFTNLDGQSGKIETTGAAARLIAHEIDHLDGILFWDRLRPGRRLWLKMNVYKRLGFMG